MSWTKKEIRIKIKRVRQLSGLGLLDDRKHTSNGAGFLEMFFPGYRGSEHYVDVPAVRDGNLITAAGTGGLAMAGEIPACLGVFRPETLEHWESYYRTGSSADFFAMMQAVQEENV